MFRLGMTEAFRAAASSGKIPEALDEALARIMKKSIDGIHSYTYAKVFFDKLRAYDDRPRVTAWRFLMIRATRKQKADVIEAGLDCVSDVLDEQPLCFFRRLIPIVRKCNEQDKEVPEGLIEDVISALADTKTGRGL